MTQLASRVPHALPRRRVVWRVLRSAPMRRLAMGIGLAVTFAGALLACGAARLPAPSYSRQPTEALQEVEYPPPPARVEYTPAAPNDDAVWVDGEWMWQGRRWAWKPGRWLAPPANATYSPWTSTRDRSGTLYVAAGRWRDAQGREVPDPQPLAIAQTRAGALVNPEGEPVPASPNAPATKPAGTPGALGAAGGEHGLPETPSGATPTGTLPKTGPVIDSGVTPVDGAIPDVGVPDVIRSDALPLGAGQ